MSDAGTISFFDNCDFDGAVFRSLEDKESGDFEVCARAREVSAWTANQRSGLVFKQEVGEWFGVGYPYHAGYGNFGVVVTGLVMI
jgi:hypothetical protein